MPTMVTMRDVAREAGVSQTTVSHVVNGSRFVSPQVEQAVRDAIERTGYVNDGIARSLKTGRSQTIGLAMSAMSNPYFASLVHVVERAVADAGYSLLLVDTHDDPVRERAAVGELLARRPDGILLATSGDPVATIGLIAARDVPVVFIDRVPDAELDGASEALNFDAVGVENVSPLIELIEGLVTEGHRRIAFVSGQGGLPTTDERIVGYKTGLERCGLVFDEGLLVSGYDADDPGRDAVAHLLGLAEPPTVVITGNDQLTIGTLRHLQIAGLQVPDDIALAAFDDFEWADLFSPRLTAIRQPVAEIGDRAVATLLSRLSDRTQSPSRVRLDAQVMWRDSHRLAV